MPSILVVVPDVPRFERWAPILRTIAEAHPRERSLVLSPDASLAQRAPEPFLDFARLHGDGRDVGPVERTHPIAVVIAEEDGLLAGPVIRALRARGASSILLGPEAPGRLAREDVDLVIPLDEPVPDHLDEATFDLVHRALGHDPRICHPSRRAAAQASSRDRFLRSPLGRAVLRVRVRWLDDFEMLRERLGRPRRLLCLGNGPSSMDVDPDAGTWDAVFRANLGWRGQGRFEEPDVVFTGLKQVLRLRPRPIVGTDGPGLVRRMIRSIGTHPWRRGAHILRVHRSDPAWCYDELGTVPTNGLSMLRTAVAMTPDHLELAGFDLFEDPRGAYPGDATTPNAYAAMHDAEVERAVTIRLLQAHAGTLRVHGTVLPGVLAGAGVPHEPVG